MKIVLDHNNYHFCSGPCDILSPEYSIVDYNNNYLLELKPYNGNRYPKITYKLPNNESSFDVVEVINCRICADCHKKSLEEKDGKDGNDGKDGSDGSDGINVIKKFILLECCTPEVKSYSEQYNI
jgi:hypothetical protein